MAAMPTLIPTRLERYMRIVKDLKKELEFSKHEGVWRWRDKDEDESSYSEAFPTFWGCICDVVGPYVEELDWEE